MRSNELQCERWLLRGLLGSLLCGCAATRPDPNPKKYPSWPEEAPAVDRRLLEDPLRLQANNGAVLESTLFNHHFKENAELLDESTGKIRRRAVPEPTALLLLSGKDQLHRLARKLPPGSEWRLFVEVARDVDIAADADKKLRDKASLAPAEVNRRRVEEVERYAHEIRPDLVVRVDLIDPNRVGMSGREASFGLLQHILSTNGTVRPDKYDPKSGETTLVEPPKIDLSVTPSNAPGALSPGSN